MAKHHRFMPELRDTLIVLQRAKEAAHRSSLFHKDRAKTSDQPNRERMSEREFVRAFGTKVAKVRYSGRADFVGLTVLGRQQGFTITRGEGDARKIRLIDIDGGVVKVTPRYLPVKSNESISNLQRGLLKWVR